MSYRYKYSGTGILPEHFPSMKVCVYSPCRVIVHAEWVAQQTLPNNNYLVALMLILDPTLLITLWPMFQKAGKSNPVLYRIRNFIIK